MPDQTILDGGLQTVPQIAVQQIIYLDFDGELTSYNGEILTLDNVEVKDALLTAERINNIVTSLNERYAAQGIQFVTQRPATADYSTIFVGKTDAFDQYGTFKGLAETIDEGNANKTDKAFVNLDSTATDTEIITTIAHETDHLTGTLNHGGDGLQAYAACNQTLTGVVNYSYALSLCTDHDIFCETYTYYAYAINVTLVNGRVLDVSDYGKATATTVNGGDMRVHGYGNATTTTVNGGNMYVYGYGNVTTTTVNGGNMFVNSGGTATTTTINEGNMCVNAYGNAMTTTVNGGNMVVYGNAEATTVSFGGRLRISGGGSVKGTIAAGEVLIFNNGTANSTTVNSGGSLFISSGGRVDSTAVNSGGKVYVSHGASARQNVVSGGDFHIYSGGVANDTTIAAGGRQIVSSGGVTKTVSVEAQGCLTLSSGGNAEGVTAAAGAVFDITVAPDTRINGTYGKKGFEMKNGTLSEVTINSGGRLVVSYGGVAVGTILDGGGISVCVGGVASTPVINSGGNVVVSYGGLVCNTTVNEAGALNVGYGGLANSAITQSGGSVNVNYGGIADHITVSSGGILNVACGGELRNTTINVDGMCTLYAEAMLTGSHSFAGEVKVAGAVNAGGATVTFALDQFPHSYGLSLSNYYIIDNLSLLGKGVTYTIKVSDSQPLTTFNLAQGAQNFNGTVSIGNGRTVFGTLTVNGDPLNRNGTVYQLLRSGSALTLSVYGESVFFVSPNGYSWQSVPGIGQYLVQYSGDNFDQILQLKPIGASLDTYNMPEGTYQCRIAGEGREWQQGNDVVVTENTSEPQKITSDDDRTMDLFFAQKHGVWSAHYAAKHLGCSFWAGTGEEINLAGKNNLADLFEGSRDANVLVLTDDSNGDALFVDDIYTALGNQARFAQIDEIRAGAGDDIVDMTSQRYTYSGSEIEIHGGSGNDTLWGGAETNILFGDAGNDRLVGASGNDILAGGSGNDRMHGGGGDDIFTFGGAWGCDTVEQLASGSVTLWFETGSEDNWNAETLTYSDGVNSVSVTGCANVTLRFGADSLLPAGAFLDAASEKVFEDKNKGFIA